MKKIYILAVAALALTACSKEEDNYIDEPIEAHFTATIGGSAVTRAFDTSWVEGDEIGISMDGRYSNIKYATPSGDGIFSGNTIYFKNKRETVTLKAYYPFKGEEGSEPGVIEENTEIDNQMAANQPFIDFLYAVKENVTGTDPEVQLTFSHRMSKVTLKFVEGNDGTDVSKINACEFGGLVLSGTFDTATGECAAKSEAEPKTLSINLPEGSVANNVALNPIILFPQSAAKDSVTLKIIDSEGQEYSCILNFKDERLEAGNNYQWTITVNKTGLVVEKSSITDWNDEDMATDAGSVLS